MKLSNTFFVDEVGEDFYVPGIMTRTWAAQMEVLDDVVRVCGKYSIRWYAD